MMDHEQCYLCGSTDFIPRSGSVRDNIKLKVLECLSCSLVFLSSFDHIKDSFYEESGMHEKDPVDIQQWLSETQLDDQRRFEYLKPLVANRSLLDFGCGAGGFLLKARKISSTAHGVELESRLNNHFKENRLIVFKNLSGLLENSTNTGYDIITLFHALEHLPDPKSVLLDLSNILNNEGQIIIEVPNADDALLTLYNNKAFSHFTYWSCHLFLFNLKTLEMLFSQIGLKINYIKQIQRYPLSNHLYWLSKGKPGGHKHWHFLDSPELHAVYEKLLTSIGKCDTIVASISKKSSPD